jgi:hypothetical protein
LETTTALLFVDLAGCCVDEKDDNGRLVGKAVMGSGKVRMMLVVDFMMDGVSVLGFFFYESGIKSDKTCSVWSFESVPTTNRGTLARL